MIRKTVAALVAVAVVSGCASSTIIHPTDPTVKVYVDGEYHGVGNVSHTDSKTSFATSSVRFEKEGCKEQRFNLDRGQEFKVGPFIAGFFLLIPFLWVSGYKAENTFEFQCKNI